MAICSNCYSNCAEIQSDKCIKYTGADITVLGIKNGDSMNYVTAAIAGFLTSTLDATGIKYEIDDENICTIVSDHLVGCTDISQKDISNALSAAICGIDTRVTNIELALDSLEATYTPNCVTGIDGTEGTKIVLQAVIDKLCEVATDLDALELNVATNYVLISDIDTYIENYLSTLDPEENVITLTQREKMVPYSVVEYYGPLTVFDASGSGTGDWEQIYLCNGDNGTPDKRGRVGVGATSGMGGGIFPNSTDPAVSGNPAYSLNDVGGSNTVTLTAAEMPSHTHTSTISTNGEHSHNLGNTYTRTDDDESGNSSNAVYHSGHNPHTGSTTYETGEDGEHTHTVGIDSAGSGGAHNNVQPVISCYYIMYIPTV